MTKAKYAAIHSLLVWVYMTSLFNLMCKFNDIQVGFYYKCFLSFFSPGDMKYVYSLRKNATLSPFFHSFGGDEKGCILYITAYYTQPNVVVVSYFM